MLLTCQALAHLNRMYASKFNRALKIYRGHAYKELNDLYLELSARLTAFVDKGRLASP
jgi:hypothetical protein